MNRKHYKATQKGITVWNRYVSFCRELNPEWHADLRYAILRDADLRNADLREANLPDIMLFDYSTQYKIIVLPDYTCIGCRRKPSEWWLSATESDVQDMADDACEWWRENGDKVKNMIKQVTKEKAALDE